MLELATDAGKFINVFGSMISQSAPHIYLSALPFAPKESLMSQLFLPKYANTLLVDTGKVVRWPAIENVLEGHTGYVSSVAFSPDGKHIVSGSLDKTIRVWDAVTGEVVSGPLQGHTDWVNSVALSPDGKHFDDNIIQIWDAMPEAHVSGLLECPTPYVRSVVFSSHCSCICMLSDHSN
jgi:WD40 repeat protein